MNMSAVYSQAYMMKCTNLLVDLSKMIINELLTPTNVTLYYLDAIMFENDQVAEACGIIMLQNIDQVLSTEKGSTFILNLPFKYMKQICSNNNLNISSEKALSQLITKYLAHRDSLPPLAEETKAIDLSLLSPEEKEARQKQ